MCRTGHKQMASTSSFNEFHFKLITHTPFAQRERESTPVQIKLARIRFALWRKVFDQKQNEGFSDSIDTFSSPSTPISVGPLSAQQVQLALAPSLLCLRERSVTRIQVNFTVFTCVREFVHFHGRPVSEAHPTLAAHERPLRFVLLPRFSTRLNLS